MFSSSLDSKRKLEKRQMEYRMQKKAKKYKRIQSETLLGTHFILRCQLHRWPKGQAPLAQYHAYPKRQRVAN